ncbi:MAG TPA: vitamin B12 dependent-methionine synthase activation domain-containing protein [Nitrospinota bacterium]|jgi:hypothetical protein|nr:vitamin B12 dependent-methionine synthase activation domain-containing protein [Nitrospinota bacterium]
MIKNLNNVYVLTNIPFEIDEKRVLRELRIPVKKNLNDLDEKNLAKELKNVIKIAYGLIHGKACYNTFQIKNVFENKVILDKSETMVNSKKMAEILKDCEYCSLFVSTIGAELENHVAEMAKDDQSGAFYLEHVGNWMAEYMAEAVNKRISQGIINAGFISKRRYSAGYGDWQVEAQKEILELTEARRIGVSITESCLMIPRKSVSALVGWGRKR